MVKIILGFFLCQLGWSQQLHHQTIAAQGANLKINQNLRISQSIGQTSVIGNYKAGSIFVGQGYIQSKTTKGKSAIVEDKASVVVYPNPVIDRVTFQFSSLVNTTVTLHLFDARGRLVYKTEDEVLQGTVTIDLSPIAQGVYFAKLETSKNSFSTKILKSK